MSEHNEQTAANKSRRRFLALTGVATVVWVGAAAYPVIRYISPIPAPDPFGEDGRAKVEGIVPADILKPGMGKSGAYGSRGLVVFRRPDGTTGALDAKCTHAGCNVTFAGDHIECHCHGGLYDLTGKNVSGPPPKPLTPLKLVEADGVLYVERVKPLKA